MTKRILLIFFSVFCISTLSYGVDAWIRINQLGYLPNAHKKAVFISETVNQLSKFTIHDALTNEQLVELKTLKSFGEFQSFKSTYILDFSSFKYEGAFYIKAGLVYSPTIYINKNTYLGTADFLLDFLRNKRSFYSPPITDNSNKYGFIDNDDGQNTLINQDVIPKTRKRSAKSLITEQTGQIGVKWQTVDGGWQNTSDNFQYGAISASVVFQLLFAYQQNPSTFADRHDAKGNLKANGIPDVLDEAKWGLDWLLKMNPEKDVLYHQISALPDISASNSTTEDRAEYKTDTKFERLAYLATGRPQGQKNSKNHSTGIASIAGKYAAVFAFGADLFTKFYPTYADSLAVKATEIYDYGKTKPGVCQSLPEKKSYNYEEENWTDDMELAATQLYRLTYEDNYLREAVNYGRMEPVTPWMCSDTARYYQWYPFLNIGHLMLASVENPRYHKEFMQNMLNGIQRVSLHASENPFNMGVPMILGSNNLVTAMASQCLLYRTMSHDTTYVDMENSLTDWLLGCNPWGTSMVVGLPKSDNNKSSVNSSLSQDATKVNTGGMVNGPLSEKNYNSLKDLNLSKPDAYARFQTPFAIYHDDNDDYATNGTSLDGTAALAFLFANKQKEGVPNKTIDYNEYTKGGITRTDINKKQITLVFSGHEYADGYKTIRKVLNKLNIKASFFFTGDFYRNTKFKSVIEGLQNDKNYLGANSDKQLIYCNLQNQDSLLVDKTTFLNDLSVNYSAMEKFGINKKQAPFFLPANESYNDSISKWGKELGVTIINPTSGTLSNTDASIPEMRDKYFSTTEIFNRIMEVEKNQGLNGYILHFHIGSDDRRQDKFYARLYSLLIELSRAGYKFVDLYKSTDIVDNDLNKPNNKQKRKNLLEFFLHEH
ncbi:MAG: glycoside hydrolase family 9 protein [Paludibacter sp.]